MKLSFFLAGIRTQNWQALYDSVAQTTSIKDYEMVFVGPYPPPSPLEEQPNVKWVQDYGCPSRCYQLGLIHSEGEYVVWPADDGTFSPTMAVDHAFSIIPDNPKGVVSFKYFEGKRVAKALKQEADTWWKIGRHKLLRSCQYAPNHYYMVMNALIRRDYLMEIGGWDCTFDHLGLGSVDLAIRLQNDGAQVVLGKKFMDISHLPLDHGDHGPIHHAHIHNDEPLFQRVYRDPGRQGRARIPVDNWKHVSEVWERRWPNGKE